MAAPPVVLVVEDHPELLNVLSDALDWEGYEVLVAADPTHAVEVLRNRKIDLLISDPLPWNDGKRALAAFEEEFPDLPIVTIADREDDDVVFLGPWAKNGNRRTLQRPYRLGDLLEACREAVQPLVDRDEGDDGDPQ